MLRTGDTIRVRAAIASDLPSLRDAIIALQDHETRLHASRLPGEQIADPYLTWLKDQCAEGGAILVAELDGVVAGFVAGWIETEESIPEAPDWRTFGYVSDICVMPDCRGRGIAGALLRAVEAVFRQAGVRRARICTLAMNELARAAYERSGYAAYEIIYEKSLTGAEEEV